jgi:hypothetical protein
MCFCLWYPDEYYNTRFQMELMNRFQTCCEQFMNVKIDQKRGGFRGPESDRVR